MSQHSEKVSVVMSVYNEEEVVSEAIKSILDQTYKNFEFIIIDDGSNDETTNIINSFTDDRIKVFENKTNRGLSFSLNKGIKHSSGQYIARMDADDRSLTRRLEKQVKILDSEPDIHVIGTWAWILGIDGERLGISQYEVGDCSPSELKSNGPYVAHPSVMMRAESLKR